MHTNTTLCQAVSTPSRLPPDLKTIRAKKREIATRYAWQAQQHSGKISQARLMTLRRLRELERLYADRQCLVDDDAGREYIEIVAHHLIHLGEGAGRIIEWCAVWTPWLPTAEAEELAKRVAAEPRKWNALSLGNELNLTPAERKALDITTFRPAGWTKKQIEKANRERRAARQKQRRHSEAKAEGRILRPRRGQPRKTTKPWEEAGMSRRTWYRHGKPSGTSIRAHQDSAQTPPHQGAS